MFQVPNNTSRFCSPANINLAQEITPDINPQDQLEYSSYGVALMIDVRDFAPHEITIKVSKRLLEVTAENDRYGRCGIFRKYFMPQNLEAQRCFSQINEAGILCVAVPWEGSH